ncbi:MAG: CrcB family protein [Ornithinimicrobium sp.]|uniref:fluoride efflux transporter FluC n=1 Tax=Ornithinimicrobium sp. TaxID=1977084 RepID=UPI0026DF54E2|nr:CrcB family protein [Ornithinimicrobium sp.]MDO5740985.1 CrcB family protein [Ornithinimicrobium sp.]
MTAGMDWGVALLLVAVGGAVGAVVRHLVSMPPLGPFRGVLLVNVLGAAALGGLVALSDRLSPSLFLLFGTGLCGAMTTWSTLAVQTWELGRFSVWRGAVYLAVTLALGLLAALVTYVALA